MIHKLTRTIVRTFAFALALCATTSAWAVIKPVAVWNGDFSTTTRGDFTLTLNGNEVAADGSKITIKGSGTATAGVYVGTDTTTYKSIACIVGFKTNSCDKTTKPVFMATHNNRSNGEHLTGLLLDTDDYIKGFWVNGNGQGKVSNAPKYPADTGIHYVSDFFGSSTSYGTVGYLDGTTRVVKDTSLADGQSTNVKGIAIGGWSDAVTKNMVGAEINYIAVYVSSSNQYPSDYNEFLKLFSPTALATAEIVEDGEDIIGGETVGINLSTSSMTANLAGSVSAAAVFVQENATLDVGAGGCITIDDGKGPLYIASGKTLTIDITDMTAPTAAKPRVDIIRGMIVDASQVMITGTTPSGCKVHKTDKGIFVTTVACPFGPTTTLSLGFDNGPTGIYLTTAAQRAFENITLQQFYDYGLEPQVRIAGYNISDKGAMAYAYNRRVTKSGDDVTAIRYEMQVHDGGWTKCVPIVLESTGDGNGITARVLGPYYWNYQDSYHLGDRFLKDKDEVETADSNVTASLSNTPGYNSGTYNAYYLHVPALYDNSHEVSGDETVGVEVPSNNRALTLTGHGTVVTEDVNLIADTISLSGSVILTVKSLPTTSVSIASGCKLILDLGDVQITTGVTFSGDGDLEFKSGKVTLNGNNSSLNGNIIVKNGAKIVAGSTSAFGKTGGVSDTRRVIAENGGTIDVNGKAMGLIYSIAGDGEGSGALINTGSAIGTGTAQANGLELTANASVGGNANYGLLASSWGNTSLKLNDFTLTKKGNASFWLYNTTINAGSGSAGKVDISAGTVQFSKKAWAAGDADFFAGTGTLELTDGTTGNTANTSFSKVSNFAGSLKITKYGSWPALAGANFPNRPSLELTGGVAMSGAYTSQSPLTIKNLKGDGTVDVTWGDNYINRYIDILQTDNTEFSGNFPAGTYSRNAYVTVRGEDDVSEANIKKLTFTARSTTVGSLTITNNVKVVFGSGARWDSATVSVDNGGYFESQNSTQAIASTLNINKGSHLIASVANCFQATTVNIPTEGVVYVDASALNLAENSEATIITATTLGNADNATINNILKCPGHSFSVDGSTIKVTNLGSLVWENGVWSKEVDYFDFFDKATITAASEDDSVTLPVNAAFDTLTLNGAGVVTITGTGGATAAINNLVIGEGVTLNASDAFNVAVGGTITGAGTLKIPSGVTLTLDTVYNSAKTDVHGALITKGATEFTNTSNIFQYNTGSSFTVKPGTTTLASQGTGYNGLAGTITIEKGAKLVSVTKDSLCWGRGDVTLNIYGKLSLNGTTRWTIGGATGGNHTVNLYDGAIVEGAGDSAGALDWNTGNGTVNVYGDAEISAVINTHGNTVTFDVANGKTLTLSGGSKTSTNGGITKTGKGSIAVTSDFNVNNLTVSDGDFTVSSGKTCTASGTLAINNGGEMEVNGTLMLTKHDTTYTFTGLTAQAGSSITIGENGTLNATSINTTLNLNGAVEVDGSFICNGEVITASTATIDVSGEGKFVVKYGLKYGGGQQAGLRGMQEQ